MDELAKEVHEDVIANGFKFKTITVRVRYQHFDTHTRSKSLLFPTNDLDPKEQCQAADGTLPAKRQENQID